MSEKKKKKQLKYFLNSQSLSCYRPFLFYHCFLISLALRGNKMEETGRKEKEEEEKLGISMVAKNELLSGLTRLLSKKAGTSSRDSKRC